MWGAGLEDGLGVVAAIPPPQPGRNSASSNREQTGKQYLSDSKKNLILARVGLPVSDGHPKPTMGGALVTVQCDLSHGTCVTFAGPLRSLSSCLSLGQGVHERDARAYILSRRGSVADSLGRISKICSVRSKQGAPNSFVEWEPGRRT
jgi:hypothetical protein